MTAPPIEGGARPELVLASASPRRRQLLEGLGIRAEVLPSGVDEPAVASGLSPWEAVEAVAIAKALAAPYDGRPVLAADTIVVVDGEALGKPRDRADAARMLRMMSGRRIEIVTALALRAEGGVRQSSAVSTAVVHDLVESRIATYLDAGDPYDKAGALSLQGAAGEFVTIVEGSKSNTIGLPLAETVALLKTVGIAPAGDLDAHW